MRAKVTFGLLVCVLSCVALEISALARVDSRSYSQPNATTTYNQWSGANNNWQRPNQTQQYPGANQGWGNTPSPALNNPWMRYNQSNYQPYNNTGWNSRGPSTPASNVGYSAGAQGNWKNPQQYPGGVQNQNQGSGGWGSRPNTTYNNSGWGSRSNTSYNNSGWGSRPNTTYNNNGWGSSGSGQNNWQNPQQYPGGVKAPNQYTGGLGPRANNTYLGPSTPSSAGNQNVGWGSSGFGQSNWKNPQQYPAGVNPQNPTATGWGQRSNTTSFAPATPPSNNNNNNNNLGWGSSGFGQNNWKNPQQYPGAASQNNTPNWSGQPTNPNGNQNWNGPSNTQQNTGFGGYNPGSNNGQPGSVPLASIGGSQTWNGGQASPGSVPLAPIGGGSQPWNSGSGAISAGGTPLAPIGGTSNSQWNAGGQASLSYPYQPQTQPQPGSHLYPKILN